MPSYEEFGSKYAKLIRDSVREDGFVKKAFVTRGDIEYSKTIRQLRVIDRELNTLVESETDRPISEKSKSHILEIAARDLGLKSANDLRIGIRAASNDDFDKVVDFIDSVKSK